MITVRGLDEMARALRRIDPRIKAEIVRGITKSSKRVADQARMAVAGLSVPQTSRAAAGISASKTGIILEGSNPVVRAVIFGAMTHWVFGRQMPVSDLSAPVFRDWIGSNWNPEDPYGVGSAVAEASDGYVLDEVGDSFMRAAREAFPN
jgi:hypothetical protein